MSVWLVAASAAAAAATGWLFLTVCVAILTPAAAPVHIST